MQSVPREWLVRGYQRAYARFKEIPQHREALSEIFLPLFEALTWAGSLEEKLRPHNEPLLRAVRNARNRVIHQWADAIKAHDFPAPTVLSAARGSRIILPPLISDWVWREVNERPTPGHPEDTGKERYIGLLAGKRVRETLDELTRVFAQESSARTE